MGAEVSTQRRQCPCGSGKTMRRCCGARSSPAKLELERSARVFAEMGLHAEAAEALSERARLSPRNPMIWNDLGVQSMAAGKPDEAQRAFMQAHTVFPEYPPALYNLGRCAMERCAAEQMKETPSLRLVQQLAGEAIGYLHESLVRDPMLYQAHALLADAYAVMGDAGRATAHREEASRMDPEVLGQVLERLPLLKRERKGSAGIALPFLSSSGRPMNVRTQALRR